MAKMEQCDVYSLHVLYTVQYTVTAVRNLYLFW